MTTRPMRSSAVGDAQIYYEGKVLEADRVTYFKDTGRVLAEGSVKLTGPDGSVTHADKMELTGDFKEGFVDTLRADTKDRTHLGATRSDKVDADTTVFHNGTYTACPSCAKHPERPPLWRLRARKDHPQEQRADALFRGCDLRSVRLPDRLFPVLLDRRPEREAPVRLPAADAQLSLHHRLWLRHSLFLGDLAEHGPDPDAEILRAPGPVGRLDFRYRLDNGYFYIDVNGIHQTARQRLRRQQPWGSGNQTNRGAITSQGTIWLSQNWKFGWDVMRLSDKWYLYDYGMPNQILRAVLDRQCLHAKPRRPSI